MTSASMATEKSVIECFTESSCPILREDDIMSRCKEIDAAKLQECLLRMTRRGDLGSRTIVNNQSEVAIYWLSHGDLRVLTPPKHASDPLRPRQTLKRSRSSFVSPLISRTTEGDSSVGGEKRLKLNAALSAIQSKQTLLEPSCSDGVRGKLDFTTSQPSTSDSSVTSTSGETVPATVDHETPTSTGGSSNDNSLNDASCLVSQENIKQMLEEEEALQRQLTDRKEELRKLKMVKLFRAKNELQDLDQLTLKWRSAAQEVAEMLLESLTSEPRPSMKELLDYYHIEYSLIHYSPEEESFY